MAKVSSANPVRERSMSQSSYQIYRESTGDIEYES